MLEPAGFNLSWSQHYYVELFFSLIIRSLHNNNNNTACSQASAFQMRGIKLLFVCCQVHGNMHQCISEVLSFHMGHCSLQSLAEVVNINSLPQGSDWYSRKFVGK